MKLIPFEKICPKVPYAFTFCVASDGKGTLGDRVAHNIAFLKKYVKHCKYILYPEISKTGRLHYHGYISFDSYSDIFLFNMETMALITNEQSADIEIDSIGQTFGDIYWYCYIRKMRHLMKPYLTKNRIIYKLDSQRMSKIKTGFKTIKEQLMTGLDFEQY